MLQGTTSKASVDTRNNNAEKIQNTPNVKLMSLQLLFRKLQPELLIPGLPKSVPLSIPANHDFYGQLIVTLKHSV